MPQGQSQSVAELEDTVARLEQREKRMRAVLSSAFTSRENRREAREELESLLQKTDQVQDELLFRVMKTSPEKVGRTTTAQARTILRRRFGKRGRIQASLKLVRPVD